MRVEFVPILPIQRALHDVPRGWERFRQYLAVLQPGTDDQLVPLFVMNPMGKDHVAARLDELIALDADGVARAATAEAAQRLPHGAGQFKAGLVLADDAQGAWTNRYLSEAQLQFNYLLTPQKRAKLEASRGNGWIVGLLWVSDEPARERVSEIMRAAIYRTAYVQHHGVPRTLRQMLVQESLALAFAGSRPKPLDRDELDYSRMVIEPQLDSTDFSTVFACLYGDEAAHSVGYSPLGLSPRAGYTVGYQIMQAYLHRTGQSAEAALAHDADIIWCAT